MVHHLYDDRLTFPLRDDFFLLLRAIITITRYNCEGDRTFPDHSALPSLLDIYVHITSFEALMTHPKFLGKIKASNSDSSITNITNATVALDTNISCYLLKTAIRRYFSLKSLVT